MWMLVKNVFYLTDFCFLVDKKIASLSRSEMKTWAHRSERDDEDDDDEEKIDKENEGGEETRPEEVVSDQQSRQ